MDRVGFEPTTSAANTGLCSDAAEQFPQLKKRAAPSII
jgi:hypothetical protein